MVDANIKLNGHISLEDMEKKPNWYVKTGNERLPIPEPLNTSGIPCEISIGRNPNFGNCHLTPGDLTGKIYLGFPSWMLAPEYFGMTQEEATALKRRKQFWQKRKK